MQRGKHILRALLAVVCLAMPWAARAASVETLLMPGKVSAAHVKTESECSACHDRADRPRQLALCLECHKPVAEDIRAQRGFHGRREAAAETQCSVCHAEHVGREGRIVNLQPAQFDHTRTDFRLEGAHGQVACASCHAAGKKYRDAPSRCADCHKAADPHEGRLGADCASCHGAKRWAEVAYDHAKTRFALQGRHGEISCASCHAGNRWKETPLQCVSCHATDDVHRTQRGLRCGECHGQRAWDDARFDHGKETGFALVGNHARTACQACHVTGNLKAKIPKDCAGCHVGSDAHAGRLGTKCEDCHAADAKAWKPSRFDHAKDGKYVLEGRHAKLGCHACHTASVATQKLGTECAGCHRARDVHGGKAGVRCSNCHGVESWRADIRFDHDLTRYPLLGQHAAVPCAQCHATRRYAGVSDRCITCHAPRDVHKGSLGKDCARCHNVGAWNLWEFDHEKEGGFALKGAHEKTACSTCHRQPAGQVKLGKECVSCHLKDDVHAGQYGRQCDRCHGTDSFRKAKPR